MAPESFVIKTPCSSANIGPGFDVIGLALSMYLELHVTIERSASSWPLNCRITYEGQGEGSDDISLDPEVNLITRVALYVLRCHDQRAFPYRQTLIPGLNEIVESMTPSSQAGLLGICLSGAGPTILALATSNFEEIAEKIMDNFRQRHITCSWMVLEPAEGTHVIRS